MKFLLPYLKPYRTYLILALFCAAVNQIFSMMDPQIFRLIIDNWVTNFQDHTRPEFAKGVGLLLLASVGVAMISRIAKNIQDYLVNVLTQKMWMRLYQDTLEHLFTLPYKIFEDQSSGQILQKLMKARESIQVFIGNVVNTIFTSLVGLTFVIIYAGTVHRLIMVFYAGILPIMASTMLFLSKKIKKAQQDIVTETAGLSGATTETLRNVALIKSLWLEDQEMNRLETTNTYILGLEIKKIKLVRILEFIQGTLINAVRVLLMWALFYLVFQESISLWEFFSLYFYSFFIFQPLYQFGTMTQSYQEAKASDQIVKELMALWEDDVRVNGTHILSNIEQIAFENVSFSYTTEPTLEDISFTVKPWTTIAFAWPSWGGKSTIIKLLLWLYRPTQWCITINWENIENIDSNSYKHLIGYVAQEAQLFAGTIKENLIFVEPTATDEMMREVLEQAQIAELVRSRDEWLDTKIGEGGLKLSGGQRQRLAIARALLRKPSLLVFDEATSSLDSIVEAEISETINQISKSRPDLITILIAHRLSTLKDADTIYVLEKWKIIESGDHHKLVEHKGLYYALRRQQSGE